MVKYVDLACNVKWGQSQRSTSWSLPMENCHKVQMFSLSHIILSSTSFDIKMQQIYSNISQYPQWYFIKPFLIFYDLNAKFWSYLEDLSLYLVCTVHNVYLQQNYPSSAQIYHTKIFFFKIYIYAHINGRSPTNLQSCRAI